MPELAEVEHYRRQWDSGLGQKINQVLIHANARPFRGTDVKALVETLSGSILKTSEARGKQMLFVAKKGSVHGWLGLHLGMAGKLRVEKSGFEPARHDHLVLVQSKQLLVFQDFRLFGRVLFAVGKDKPVWWTKQAPDLLSKAFSKKALTDFLRRRKKAPIKAVLLMQERFPGIGNWMADEILWRAEIHPRQAAGSIDEHHIKSLYRETKSVCREALRIIGKKWGDPPESWLFPHRWAKGGTCPKTGAKLQHATVGGRTTCWSPGRQKLVIGAALI